MKHFETLKKRRNEMSDSKKEVTVRKWTFSLEDRDVPFSKNGIDGIGFLDRFSDEV